MLNSVNFLGRICTEITAKTVKEKTVVNFRFAVNRDYKDDSGEYPADFFNAEAWGGTADFISKNFEKGKLIVINGSLKNNDFTDRNGNKVYSNVIVISNAYFAGDKKQESAT